MYRGVVTGNRGDCPIGEKLKNAFRDYSKKSAKTNFKAHASGTDEDKTFGNADSAIID